MLMLLVFTASLSGKFRRLKSLFLVVRHDPQVSQLFLQLGFQCFLCGPPLLILDARCVCVWGGRVDLWRGPDRRRRALSVDMAYCLLAPLPIGGLKALY